MGEVSGGPSLMVAGWVKGLPPAQITGVPPLAFEGAPPSTPLLALPHPQICTLICLPYSSVPSCFGFNKYLDGVWARFWDYVLGTNLGVGEVKIAGKMPGLYFPSPPSCLVSFHLSLTAPRKASSPFLS